MNCKGLFGRLFGHNYEPRYSLGASRIESIERATTAAISALVDGTRTKTYHGDICTRCGHKVEVRDAAE